MRVPNENSMSHCFYEHHRPQEGDYVVAEIATIMEGSGYFVNLLEYGGIQGFVGIREASTTKFRKLKGLVKVGNVEVMQVVAVDGEHIDLTRKWMDETIAQQALQQYHHMKSIYKWLQYNKTHDEETKNQYISEIVQKRKYTEETIEDSRLHRIHADVQSAFKKAIAAQIQSTEITLASLVSATLDELNHHLDVLRSSFNVDIETVNTKKCIYRITTRSPASEGDFQTLLDAIKTHPLAKGVQRDSCKPQATPRYDNIQPRVNIGVIGHVSHGKTTLIQSITGVDTRRHKKEIETNRTLKLGYTNTTVTQCRCRNDDPHYKSRATCACDTVHVSIIDCPGHNILLSTMIAGAHLMDAALLLVAGNESFPQFQTKEHLDIVRIIDRVDDIVCVQNKLDLVSHEAALQQKCDIAKYLEPYDVHSQNIIPVSAQKDINIDLVLESLFHIAKQKQDQNTHTQHNNAHGVIVRTFDINKPGSKEVHGVVIGGSILEGSFKVGDRILIMPQRVPGTIVMMKSDLHILDQAHAGGLIAIQTDINPVYCDTFIGSSFILADQLDEARYFKAGSHVEVKYYPLEDMKHPFLTKGQKVVINVLANDVECQVIKSNKDKYKCLLELSKPLYILNEFRFTIMMNKRLFGYGKEVHTKYCQDTKVRPDPYIHTRSYADMYDRFKNKLSQEGVVKPKVTLPVPKIEYLNTFSTVLNFGDYCRILGVPDTDLGMFIFTEQGFRSWSINGKQQLVVKGRLTEQKFMSNVSRYCSHKICSKCKSIHTAYITDRGVKKIRCNDCQWCEPLQKP